MKKLLFILIPLLFALALPARAADYRDVGSHWAADAIARWSDHGVVTGADGTFRPDASMTRAELAALLDRLLGYQLAAENTFSDLPAGAWYTPALLRAAQAGVITGSGGALRPNDSVTRQEAAVILGRALSILPSDSNMAFTDAKQIASWASGYVSVMARAGYLTGYGGAFHPTTPITRAQVVTVLDRMVGAYYAKPGDYTPDITGGMVLVAASDVTVRDAALPAGLLIAPGVGDGEVELDNLKVAGRIAVKGGGPGAVLLRNVTCVGGVSVNRDGAWVWVAAEGDCRFLATFYGGGATFIATGLDDDADVEVEVFGPFGTDEILVLQGRFTTVTNHADNAQIDAEGTIGEFIQLKPAVLSGGVNIHGDEPS